jgi:predicted phage terminase large subunit-like protein
LDCLEVRIEPKDLKDTFLDFWQDSMRHKVAPLIAAIEKKSTGVTLLSTLRDMRGIAVRDIERHAGSGSKTERFIQIQPYVASKRISFTKDARHVDNCIKHMSKITANNTHRHDDIADTCADAIKIALIDKLLQTKQSQNDKITSSLYKHEQSQLDAQRTAYNGNIF